MILNIKRPWLILVSLLALIGGGWYLMQPSPSVSVDLSSLSFNDAQNRPFDTKQLSGKIVVINFWASWCAPCIQEMPLLDALFKENSQKGVQFVGVNIDHPEKGLAFLNEVPVTYPVLMASSDGLALSRQWGNQLSAVPYTIILDQRSRIVFQYAGKIHDVNQLQAIISAL